MKGLIKCTFENCNYTAGSVTPENVLVVTIGEPQYGEVWIPLPRPIQGVKHINKNRHRFVFRGDE